MDSTDDITLKNLLTRWRCDVLYNLFKEEDIDLEELALIKHHHVKQLLQPYKMGVRIRFESYLEQWRNSVGIPFKTEPHLTHTPQTVCHCNQQCNSNQQTSEDHNIKAESDTTTNISNVHSSEEITDPKRHNPVQIPQTLIKVVDSDTLMGCPTSPTDSTDQSNRPIETLNLDMNTSKGIANVRLKDSSNLRQHCPFSLTEILQRSGSKGKALIQYYQVHQVLTTGQRSQLVQLICDFFKQNKFHMSLQRSHELENEILKMFPSEKLSMYRSEKRGKIYIKYTNMKSYNRERQKALKQRNTYKTALDYEFGEQLHEANNMDAVSCDSWPETFDTDQVFVKSETLEYCK